MLWEAQSQEALSLGPGLAYSSGMIRIRLSPMTRDELQPVRRPDLPTTVRDPLEMALLSDAGGTAARIAEHTGFGSRTASLPGPGSCLTLPPGGHVRQSGYSGRKV